MNIWCHKCKKIIKQLDEAEIPDSGTFVTCHECGNRVFVKRRPDVLKPVATTPPPPPRAQEIKETYTCKRCGYDRLTKYEVVCPGCYNLFPTKEIIGKCIAILLGLLGLFIVLAAFGPLYKDWRASSPKSAHIT